MIKSYLITGLLFLNYSAYAQSIPPEMDQATIQKVIVRTSELVTQNYVFPDKALLISDHIRKLNKNKKYNLYKNAQNLAKQLTADIQSVNKDKHLRIIYDPELEKDIISYLNTPPQTNQIKKQEENKEKTFNFFFRKLEILPSNIGYIEFTNFPTPSEEAQKTIHSAMQFISNTDALIIDLRRNRGGNGTTSTELLGYFFNEKIKTGKSFNRIENKWTDDYIENIPSIAGGLYLGMPVYILTSKWTFSAAEGFVYTMKYLRNSKIIGETTAGGAHLTRSFSSGSGFVAFIPFTRSENIKTGTDWEITGIVPDIEVKSGDPLILAQNEILKEKLLKTNNENEQRKIKWLLNYNLSKESKHIIATEDLKKYAGRFAEFEISVVGNELLFRNTNSPDDSLQKMIPITNTLFQVGLDYQVNFLKDKNYNTIKMYWSDGWAEDIDRTK
ncbi:S41 family peptidase [Elizabethkingia meningoseptica]|uniref:S41 family peptidase n=1 Tax=Elizabethkingia meningoseptica TaxID=238 RepID=UPI0038923FD8